MYSVAALLDNSKASDQLFFRGLSDKIMNNFYYFLSGQKMDAQKDYSTIRRNRITQDVPKIRIASDKNRGFFFDELVNFFVRGGRFNIADIFNFVTSFLNGFSDRARAICINKKSHKLFGGLRDKLLLISQKRCVKYTGLDIFGCNRAKFLFDLFEIHSTGSQGLENYIYRRARAFDAGFSMLDIRIYTNMFFKSRFIDHFIFSFMVKLYHSVDNMSRNSREIAYV